jgi:hypothetical protein
MMDETKAARRIRKTLAPAGAGVGFILMWALVALGQNTPQRGKSTGSYPRLPGAVTKAPAWLGADAPFDVAKFFEAVPRDQNAAPLYLDALFEFSGELEVCFPEGAERARRSQAAKDRSKQYFELTKMVGGQSVELDAAAVDALIKQHDTGYRKLADAQRRTQCVFETGLGIAAILPHAQASRQVARISSLKVQRAVQRGDLAAAIREIDVVLRLARDLRPRGALLTQLVGDAVCQMVLSTMIPTLVASPRMRDEHIERLIKLLDAHDLKSRDGVTEGWRAEYLNSRTVLEEIVHHQSDLAKAMKVKPGGSVVRSFLTLGAPGNAVGGAAPVARSGDDWDALVARTTSAEISRHAKEMRRYYGALLDLAGLPYAERLARIVDFKAPTVGTDPLSLVVRMTMPPEMGEAANRAAARAAASLRATECLLAFRRWQKTHSGVAKNLAAVIKGSGLTTVPIDPCDGKPMRFAIVDGQAIVYSVGRDGVDDGGLVDSDRDQKPTGDLIYRLPPIEEKHILRP